MSQVFVHKYAGILSAYGMALADVVHEAQEPCAKIYSIENLQYFQDRLEVRPRIKQKLLPKSTY